MNKKYLTGVMEVFSMAIFLTSTLRAQTPDSATETALMITGTLTAFFIVLIFFLVFVLRGNIETLVNIAGLVWNYVAPKATEKAIRMDEDFDGITELDNRVPPWFNYLFGATVVFAVIYMVNYHVVQTSPLPQSEYAEELAAADVMMRVRIASEGEINEDTMVALIDEASLNEGKEKFRKNCVSCHGNEGGGVIGPNLTDRYWIHGGGIRNVFGVIKNGVPAKGMISWKLVFTPQEIQQIASYVLSLQGANPPPGGKPQEGNLWVEPNVTSTDSSKAVVKS